MMTGLKIHQPMRTSASKWYIPMVQEKFRIDFQDGGHGGHLGFQIRLILANSDLHITLILPTKFPVNWPFGSEEVQNRFSRWRPSWISDQNDFSCFDRQSSRQYSCDV